MSLGVEKAVFSGKFQHTLDQKGRIFLPSKFRDALKKGVVIAVWPGNCLLVIPTEDWPRWEQKIEELPYGAEDAQSFIRYLYSHLTEEVPDRQGRILIPQELQRWAGLEREVIVIGVGRRLEIWDAKTWQAYEHKAADSFSEFTSKLL